MKRESIVPDNLDQFCDYTSMHGFVWYQRTDLAVLKTAIFVTMVSVGVFMIVYVSVDFAAFLNTNGVTDATTWTTATSIMYPNVSICNAKYFSNERLKGMYSTVQAYLYEVS